jgi:hypothetical protein
MRRRTTRERLDPWIGNGRVFHQGVVIAEIRYRIERRVDVVYTMSDAAGPYIIRSGSVPSGADGIILEMQDGRWAPIAIEGHHLQIIGNIEDQGGSGDIAQ